MSSYVQISNKNPRFMMKISLGEEVMGKNELVEPLLSWFRETNRDLPWRKTYNPYHVWISEIMLQQTQMERGVGYFLRWIERFPGVADVAEADEQEILKHWEGLGYYARARNLHKAAKLLVKEFHGEVPCDVEQLLLLPGVGSYTAAAIASVAGNRDVPVVDANVCRLFSRIFNIDQPVKSSGVQKRIHLLTKELLPKGKARQFNQALMDLGGLICTPKNPRCPDCPIRKYCIADKSGVVASRPVQQRPKKTINIYRVAGIIRWDGKVYIQKRAQNDVWGGLWEFPGGEVDRNKTNHSDAMMVSQVVFDDCGLDVAVGDFLCSVQHQYTHHKITLDCYLCDLRSGSHPVPELNKAVDFRWVALEEFAEYGFPAGARKVIEFIKSNSLALLDIT